MTSYPAPVCLGGPDGESPACRHLRSQPEQVGERATCAAFPQGIPDGIFWEAGDHTKPWPGDRGMQYEPMPTA